MRLLSCGGEFNHHAKYMCDSIYDALKENYIRITTFEISSERKKLGYQEFENIPYNHIIEMNDYKQIREIISWCDVVDFGAAPNFFLKEAIRQNKIIFIRSERLFKEGYLKILYPPIFIKFYKKYFKNRNNNNIYYLSIGAYTGLDLVKLGVKKDKILNWAYCPEFEQYSVDNFNNRNIIKILWCGRLIKWKHPEITIQIAKKLKEKNIRFELNIVGDGPLYKKIKKK